MPHITDPDYAVIEALIYALLNSNTPILQKKLNEDKGLGIEMGWAPQLIHGKSAMQLLFKCNKFTDLEALRKEVKNIFETIADSGIGEEILAQVKQRWMINQYHKQENLDLKSVELAILSSFNACQLSVNLANNLQKVTNDDIKRIVRKYLTKDNEFAVYLKPSEEKNHDKTTTQDFKKQAERIIDPLRMQELTDSICGKQSPCIPKMDITKSAESGHTIICNENHNLPLMSLRIFSPRKPLSTKDQLKMQILRGILNQAGTQSYKAEELEKRINDIGAGFHFRDDADGFWFKIDSSTVGDNLKRCAELFKEFLLYNKLDLETFTKVKSAIKNSIKEENNNPEALAVRGYYLPRRSFLTPGYKRNSLAISRFYFL
jgi:predicted Zn-dependent peptidase